MRIKNPRDACLVSLALDASLLSPHACLAPVVAKSEHGERRVRRRIPLTPLPDGAFSPVTRVACGIFHPDPWRVIAPAPGNGFWI